MLKIPQRLYDSDSGGGSSNKNQTQTTTSTPYAGAKPMIDESLKAAQNLYHSGALNVKSYGGQMVAPTSPATQESWNQIAGLATQPGIANQTADWASNVLQPGFLTSQTPGMSGVLDQARNQANAQISLSGRSGSGSHEAAVAGALAPILYQDYGNKMALQAQVAGMSPQIQASQYYGANQLGQVGQQQQGQLQDQINAAMQKYYADQGAKANELALYQQLLSGNYGGTSQVTGPVQGSNSGTNPWLTGAGLMAQLAGSYLGSA